MSLQLLKAEVLSVLADSYDETSWSDAVLEEALRQALTFFHPYASVRETSFELGESGYEHDISSLSAYEVIAIAWPWADSYRFEDVVRAWRIVEDNIIRMDSMELDAGEALRIQYRPRHTIMFLDGAEETTFWDAEQQRFVLIAARFALLSRIRYYSHAGAEEQRLYLPALGSAAKGLLEQFMSFTDPSSSSANYVSWGGFGTMRVEIVIPPVSEPLDLSAVKTELRIDSAQLDDQVSRLIYSATSFFEEETGFALIERTLRAYLRFWPKATNIQLPYPPLASVTSVTHYPLGAATVMASDGYHVDRESRLGSVVLIPGQEWPYSANAPLYPPGIEIEYVAGFGEDGGSVPGDILECLMQIISFWEEVPEAVYVPGTNKTSGKVEILPLGAQQIIERYRKKSAG